VRLIGVNDEQHGIVETHEAMRIAQEAGMDLVEVAPTARPPVCRVMDYGKWKYHQKKKQKKGGQEQQLKEVRLRPKTDSNDKGIKIKRAIRFFGKGHKVQFTILFRGRERFHREIGFEMLKEIADDFGEKVKVERPPSMDGRKLIMILAPVKDAFKDLGDVEDDHDDDLDLDDSGVMESVGDDDLDLEAEDEKPADA
jgi:translation initiation factor IF-3